MPDNDLASADGANTDETVSETANPNPFKESATTPPKPAAQPVEEDEEVKELAGSTNDSINMSLEDVKNVDVLKGMVTRLRHENANHRAAKKELATEVEVLRAEKLKRAKSVQEANERVELAEARTKAYVIKAAATEYDVDEDLYDLIDGDTDEEIFERARRLRDTKVKKPTYEYDSAPTFDPFAGRRGRSVRPDVRDPGGDYLRDLLS